MRLIIVGSEYTGKATLVEKIVDWRDEVMGPPTPKGIVRYHDHFHSSMGRPLGRDIRGGHGQVHVPRPRAEGDVPALPVPLPPHAAAIPRHRPHHGRVPHRGGRLRAPILRLWAAGRIRRQGVVRQAHRDRHNGGCARHGAGAVAGHTGSDSRAYEGRLLTPGPCSGTRTSSTSWSASSTTTATPSCATNSLSTRPTPPRTRLCREFIENYMPHMSERDQLRVQTWRNMSGSGGGANTRVP